MYISVWTVYNIYCFLEVSPLVLIAIEVLQAPVGISKWLVMMLTAQEDDIRALDKKGNRDN